MPYVQPPDDLFSPLVPEVNGSVNFLAPPTPPEPPYGPLTAKGAAPLIQKLVG